MPYKRMIILLPQMRINIPKPSNVWLKT